MEKENSGDVEVKLSDKVDVTVHGDEREILINNDSHPPKKDGKEEHEETVLDEEFIKVEKEPEDIKDSVLLQKSIEVEETPSATNLDSRNSVTSISLLEVEDKVKSLEVHLETLSKELQISESEKAALKSEVGVANEKLQTVNKHCEELELDRKRMKEEILAAEQKYELQLTSFQETLGALDVKHEELGGLKESFSGLSAELESTRKKMEELEVALASSENEKCKLEELSTDRSSHAELESKRASELERMLDAARQSARDMEDQMGGLQEELTRLYNKVAESQQVEEVLKHTTLDLAGVQEKLNLSESLAAELEQKLISKEEVIRELNQDIETRKASQEQMDEKVLALENLLSSSEDELQSKLVKLEEVELKLQHEEKTREAVELSIKSQEMQILNMQEEMVKLTGDKESLQRVVDDLNSNLSLTKELCSQLEDKFNDADQNFNKTNSLLTEALSFNEELEQKLKTLENLHGESRTVAETASQRSRELEDLIQASRMTEEDVREQLRANEMKLISAEQRNVELEEQVALAQLKFNDADGEIEVLNEKITELNTMISKVEEEREESSCHFQAYGERIEQLESSLSKASSRNSELVQELKELAEMRDAHEGRANAAHQRGLELEDLVHNSHAKAEDAGKKASELELLLEAARQQTQDLEQLLSVTESKYRDAEEESRKHSSRVSELSTELEAFQTRSASLEFVVQAANEKESQLTDMLNAITEEKKKLEDLSNISSEKLLQSEQLIEVLRSELKSAQEKLESVEEDLKVSVVRENELLEKLRSTEEQLEHHGRTVEQSSARCLELESLHESVVKDSELKLQAAVGNFTQKDLEVKQLHEQVRSLEEQIAFYKDQAIEATEKEASLKAELDANEAKFVALENTVDELKRNVSENELKIEQSFSENELLAGTNSELKSELEGHQSKINELNELLSSIHAEKKETAEQLAHHMKTVTELSNERSRGLELHSAAESRLKDTEVELQDALERFAQRDSEARDLNEKKLALEAELKLYEEHLKEANSVAENQKVELEEALLTRKNLETFIQETQSKAEKLETENEDLARANMNQSQQLATYETKVNELESALEAVIKEKEVSFMELHSSRKTIEDLKQQHAFDEEKLQSQISSIMEENSMLNKMYENAKDEHQAVMVQMEGTVTEHNARELSHNSEVENLKTKVQTMELTAAEKEAALASVLEKHENILHERDLLKEQLLELQNDLNLLQTTIAEQKEQSSKMELEREAAISNSLHETEAEHERAAILEKQVEELKQQLQLTELQYKEKVENMELIAAEKETALASVMEKHENILHERDVLKEQLVELQNDLKLVQTTMAEQKEQGSKMELEREAALKNSLHEIEAEHARAALLEKQIEELKQQFQITESQYKDKATEESKKFEVINSEFNELKHKLSQNVDLEKKIAELQNKLQLEKTKSSEQAKDRSFEAVSKDGVEVTSRDLGFGTSSPVKRKSKKRSEEAHQATETIPISTAGPSGVMAFKFILGVAIVSVIIGIILGKKY